VHTTGSLKKVSVNNTSDIAALLQSYPRQRPPLTPAHQRIYAEQYRLNREGSRLVESLAQRLEVWMHHRVASLQGGPILELGAGTLNHRRFEPENVDYDIVEPFRELYEGRPEMSGVRNIYDRLRDIRRDQHYQRIISIAVLEHMTALPEEVAEAALRLAPDGVFQAGIPSEGGMLWWIGWRFSTGISYYLRTRLDYGVVMRHEHVNAARDILAVIRHLFRNVQLKRFPFPGDHFSFYTYIEARRPDRGACERLLGVSRV
jgi:SAM-dependent methyltransferase